METHNKWVRQTQERKEDYWFNGKFYITSHVLNELPPEEVHQIYW